MLSLNSTLSSIVENNLTLTNAAVAQATQRLASGLRINSAADDPAGYGAATSLLSQINGLNAGLANANDAASMVQTASTGLSSITSALQSLRTLALQASSTTLSTAQRTALQSQASQQIAQINGLVAQTSYNGKTLLNGSVGTLSIQVGANPGQTVSLNLGQGVSAASLGNGTASAGTVLGTFSGVNLNADGTAASSGTTGAITAINVQADGSGGLSFTDQNGDALSSAAVSALFTQSTGGGGTC